MKEAFDLIKERLKEERDNASLERASWKNPQGVLHNRADARNGAFIDALSIVSEVEAEYGNGWIDVKDRLPEKDGYYLTCDHKGNIHVFYHHPSYVTKGSNMPFGICKNHPQFYKPIAWMELPNQYTRKKGV